MAEGHQPSAGARSLAPVEAKPSSDKKWNLESVGNKNEPIKRVIGDEKGVKYRKFCMVD